MKIFRKNNTDDFYILESSDGASVNLIKLETGELRRYPASDFTYVGTLHSDSFIPIERINKMFR